METLYVKTEGPVPWTARVTAGRVYEATQRAVGLRYQIVDDAGLSMAICTPRCTLDGCYDWIFCDSTGTPVPAPWESEKVVVGYDAKSDAFVAEPSGNYSQAAAWMEVWETLRELSPEFCWPDGTGVGLAIAEIRRLADYRAHAERLAEALELFTKKPPAGMPPHDLLAYFTQIHELGAAALSAYNKAKGEA